MLVATDVAARGLDIADLPAVFNFDVPFNAEDYVHRIGRTGRAGASGLAVTLVSRDDMRLVGDIEKLIKKKIEIEPFELDDEPPAPRAPRDDAARRRRRARRGPRRRSAARRRAAPRAAPRDPFFDQPYEPSRLRRAGLGSSQERRGAGARAAVAQHQAARRRSASLLGGGAA